MKLHLPKTLLAAVVAVGAALPAMQAEEADTSTTTVLSSTDLSYNPTIYTLGDPKNDTLADVYQTTLVPAEGSEPAKWDVATTATTSKTWGELYGNGYNAPNTDNYNTLRVVSAKEYGFKFTTLSLAGVIVESSANGASFKGLGGSTRNIKIGKTGEESASYFGGSFTFDSYTTSSNDSAITLNGTQTWYVASGKEVTLKAKAGITNEGTWTVEGGSVEITNGLTTKSTIYSNSAITLSGGTLSFYLGDILEAVNPEEAYSEGKNGYFVGGGDFYLVKGTSSDAKIETVATTATETQSGKEYAIRSENGSLIVKLDTRENDGGYFVNTTVNYGGENSSTDIVADTTTAICMNGGTLYLNQALADGIAITTFAEGSVIHIGAGVTLDNTDVVAEGTKSAVTGGNSAVYNMGSAGTANVNLTNSEWSGKVVFSGNIDGLGLSDKGHSGSSVELNGWDGYFKQEIAEYTANIALNNASDGYAVKITNGYSDMGDTAKTKTEYTFSGDISGSGIWQMNKTSTNTITQNYVFTGDTSEWTGQFQQKTAHHTTNLTFTGTDEVNADIVKEGGTLNVTIDDSELSVGTEIKLNKAITATTLTLGSVNDTADNRASVTINNAVNVDTLNTYASTALAKGNTITANTIKVGGTDTAPVLKVTGADGSNAANLTGATEVGGKIQQTTSGITVSNMTLANVKLTGANVNTAIALQDVAGAATLATGTYTVAAVAGAATAAAENVALSYTLGGLTGLTLDNADTKLVINTGDVLAAVGEAESFTLSFNLGDGISLYDSEWTAEALAGVITFGGALGEWLSGSETQYTLASDAVATASLDGLVPTVTYAMTDGVLTSISISGNIPEPTTATLSLLALAGLAARRRRR